MKQIYILLSRTRTIPSRLIYTLTDGAYTHSSIALTRETDRFYSYARRSMHNILNAGFIVEDLHSFVFAKHADCHCSLFVLEVSDDGYEKMKKCIARYQNNYHKAKYGFVGILPLRLGIRVRKNFKLVCSQFVAFVLQASEEIALPKDPSVMLPNDFLEIPNIKKIYDGPIKNCRFDQFCLRRPCESVRNNIF